MSFVSEGLKLAKQTREPQRQLGELTPDPEPTIGEKIAAGPIGEGLERRFTSPVGKAVRGAVEGAAESIVSIPRGFETLARTPGKIAEGKGLLGALQEAEAESVIPGGREVVGFLREKADVDPESQEAQTNEIARITGEVATMLPGLISIGTTAVRGTARGVGKIPALMTFLRNSIVKGGVRRGFSKRVMETAVKDLWKVKKLTGDTEELIFSKAQTLAQKAQKYKLLRNQHYQSDMLPLMEKVGHVKVNGQEMKVVLRNISQEEKLSNSFRKWASSQLAKIGKDGNISVRDAVKMRQEAAKRFSSFKPKEGVVSVKEDSEIARGLGRIIGNSIDNGIDAMGNQAPASIKKIRDINAEYSKATRVLESLDPILGKATETAGRQKVFLDAPGRLQQTLAAKTKSVGTTSLLDDFAKEFPEAQDVLDELRFFIAADEIIASTPSASLGVGVAREGVRPQGNLLQAVKDLFFSAKKGALGTIQRSQQTPLAPPVRGVAVPGGLAEIVRQKGNE